MSRTTPRYCRSCGAVAPVNGRFCAHCGASLSMTTPYPAPESRPPTNPGEPPRYWADRAQRPEPTGVVEPSVGGSVRMGFGIALGMLLFAVVVGLIGIAVLAMVSGALTWPFATPAQRFEGTGPATSAAFQLDGPYRVEWSASPLSPTACRLDTRLLSTDANVDYQVLSSFIEPGPPDRTGAAEVNAPAGTYTLAVESDCTWTIRFVKP